MKFAVLISVRKDANADVLRQLSAAKARVVWDFY